MKLFTRVLSVLAIVVAAGLTAANANCRLPPAPSKIPDGSTATEQQMVTAMQTIQEYNHDVQTYLKCLQFEVRESQLSNQAQMSLHNAAVVQLRQVATEFNRQVRVFKSKHS